MAKVHCIPLPPPFWSLEVLELDGLDKTAEGEAIRVKRLYLVDTNSVRGLRLLKSRPHVPPSAGFAGSIAGDNGAVDFGVVE